MADQYKGELSGLYQSVRQDASSTLTQLTRGIHAISTSFGTPEKNRTEKPKEETEAGKAEGGDSSGFFSMFRSRSRSQQQVEEVTNKLSFFLRNAISIEPPDELVEQERKTK